MANDTATYHPQQRVRENSERAGAIRQFFGLLISLVGWMLFALLLNVVVELSGMVFGWWDLTGSTHARAMLLQELDWLNSDFKQVLGNPLNTAIYASEQFYQGLWVWRGEDYGEQLLGTVGSGNTFDYLRAAFWVMQVFAVRVVVILFSLPIFGAFGVVALTDGLLQRDLRRFGGGRESGYIWHNAMRLLKPAIILPVVIYLGLPISLHPNVVVLPFALLFAFAVWVGAAWFKKYL
ncbi:MAG: TIGR03747 family integrating conjugative element membrane protein [Candidatus Thiodiazotropha sp. (ex Lucinoma borealis)]|nr:TIGR03747 family integrating conjugative element membrane protein [Candidatus Thiodiazotropha sp. (ex Lucinoma borealis)]MCU7865416.1 TIGR03747 family integrating conjugative element membrane protein [Candidatus Thiodiazotropha sp. (ex Lucinoma borealis)]